MLPAPNAELEEAPVVKLLHELGHAFATKKWGGAVHGMGLMFPVGSYCGEFMVSFTACREMLPDPEFMEQCIRDSYAEMR